MSLLELADVHAGYGETEVLSGVTMDVEEGEVVTLVGRNGVGKTTTLRSIVGVVEPTGGEIRFRGEEITGSSSETVARDGIGFVPEERRVFPGLTVTENLKMGRFGGADTAHRRSVEDIWELDAFENLRERKDSRGTDLSGGEQQMLAIARALVAGADLLLLDEPTEGLAPIIVERVADLVRELNEEGITVLLVEQNVAVASALADRVYILDKGSIVYEGTPEELDADEDVRDRHLGISM
ncbi:ABC transporter ATP-binding protein [Haloarchaeobius iranensis]|uniref:Amino acid/amide ABC transporter ATP-binding protein 2, HAAT family n=1 Tax=Haloarchaeobius iranensis TaxID=996166 RepID=A0A1H0ASI1_9EURY|nr:ABC transporter ATP-binding protein [Haloarchaeobius iranensis]SDN36498.1 amino acid/amide ABC transporter ATP-binding protein 2, HAAT family [Haloarchaeobius iranensis]